MELTAHSGTDAPIIILANHTLLPSCSCFKIPTYLDLAIPVIKVLGASARFASLIAQIVLLFVLNGYNLRVYDFMNYNASPLVTISAIVHIAVFQT